jgi:hypothetical protein
LSYFVTDSSRPTLLIDVEFTWLDGQPHQVYTVYQPQLDNPAVEAPLNQSGVKEGKALLSSDPQMQVKNWSMPPGKIYLEVVLFMYAGR